MGGAFAARSGDDGRRRVARAGARLLASDVGHERAHALPECFTLRENTIGISIEQLSIAKW
jgi:hypothetical protein